MDASDPQVHEAVKPVSWLIGKWYGENGVGIYPTIKTFKYNEEIEFTHPTPFQPVLHVKSTSWLVTDDGKKLVAHCEYGFLKVLPNTNPPAMCYTSTQNTSIVTVEEGEYNDEQKLVKLTTKYIDRSTKSKQPELKNMERKIQLKDNELHVQMNMSTSTTLDLNEHLSIVLKKGIVAFVDTVHELHGQSLSMKRMFTKFLDIVRKYYRTLFSLLLTFKINLFLNTEY